MRRLVAVLLVAAATVAGSARADTFSVVPDAPVTLPGSEVPNAETSLLLPQGWTMFASQPRQLAYPELKALWQRAGSAYGIPWEVLGAINKIETNFGGNMGPSSAGAVGWMQFMPSTWLRWGLDASGDGFADPWDPEDAVYAAARYLAAAGGTTDLRQGVFAYNHADWYVNDVLSLAQLYAQSGGGDGGLVVQLDQMQERVDAAEQRVADANQALLEAQAAEAVALADEQEQLAKTDDIELLSERLEAQKAIVQAGLDRHADVSGLVAQRQQELAQAEAELTAARDAARGASFTPGAGTLLGAPHASGQYVFPVGGGPTVVSVGHDHHDYPAADIAAPYGSPAYALESALVLNVSNDDRCGLGIRLQGADGLEWQYCHLAYVDPSVVEGAMVAAGAPVGLVGSTGHSTGPHLHLALKPETAYPQEMDWFKSFAGVAFSWQDAETPLQAPSRAPVFAVLPAESAADDVVLFSR
jgi:murein DD-endopeptidase MepM/ murein hydrolase activator NlpD